MNFITRKKLREEKCLLNKFTNFTKISESDEYWLKSAQYPMINQ